MNPRLLLLLTPLLFAAHCEKRIGDRIYVYHEFPTAVGPSGSVAVVLDLERHVIDEHWAFGQSAFDTVIPGGTAVWAAHERDATTVHTETSTLNGQSSNVTSDVAVDVTQNPMPPGGNMMPPPGD